MSHGDIKATEDTYKKGEISHQGIPPAGAESLRYAEIKSLAEELAEKYKFRNLFDFNPDMSSWKQRVNPDFIAAINEAIEHCAREAECLLVVHPIAGSCAERIRSLKSKP